MLSCIAVKSCWPIDLELGICVCRVDDLTSPDRGIFLRIRNLSRLIGGNGSFDVAFFGLELGISQCLFERLDSVKHNLSTCFGVAMSCQLIPTAITTLVYCATRR